MLNAALELFHRKGIHATSVDEILENSETGKSQFYHYFKSKDGLVEAVVEDFADRLRQRSLPLEDDIRTLDDVERWLETFVEFQRKTGAVRSCPMATIALGLDESQEPIRRAIARVFADAKGPLRKFFESQREEGKLAADVDPEALSDFCYVIMQGGLVVSRVEKDPISFERGVRQAMHYLRSITS